MHELGVSQAILSAALEAATEHGATRVNDVRISLGELAGVLDDALRFNWDIVRRETIAEEATLTIHNVPLRSRCRLCEHEYDHGKYDFTCPECGGTAVETLTGRELTIDAIDIDLPKDLTAAAGDTAPGE